MESRRRLIAGLAGASGAALLSGCLPRYIATTLGRAPEDRGTVPVWPVILLRDLPFPPLPPIPPPGIIEQGITGQGSPGSPEVSGAVLPAPTVLDPARDAAFLRNHYTGNVRFGGGLIRTGPVALEARARLIEFSLQDACAEQGRRWLTGALQAALARRRVDWSPAPTANAPPPPEIVPARGLHPDDGRDNLNLPRASLRASLWPDPPARSVLVPWLGAYYSHNGGWFLGQQYGCMGGARIGVMIALYWDGAPVWQMEATGRFVEGAATPSTAELDQFLLNAEAQVEAALSRELLR